MHPNVIERGRHRRRVAVDYDVMVKEAAEQVQLAIRIPADWVRKLDALAEAHSKPGLELARANAIRMAMARGLLELEAELKTGRGKR